jgi:sugar phosphate permease
MRKRESAPSVQTLVRTSERVKLTTGAHAPYGWQIVVAAVMGSAFSPATLINVPFGLFVTELQRAFGWSRSEVTAGQSLFLGLLVVSLPIAGRLVDRVGARRVAIPSTFLYGTALASLALLGSSPSQFYLMYGLLAVLGAGAQSLTFIRVISAWFDRRRGLVIGICMAGFGLGYAIVPLITRALISWGGWRSAYAGLGVLAVAGTLPVIALLLRDTPQEIGLQVDGQERASRASSRVAVVGSTLGEAARSRDLWLLAASFLLVSFALNSVQSQIVPLLTDRGMAAATAALMLSAIGVGSFPGRLIIGFTIDRVFAPWVAVGCYVAAAIAVLGLLGEPSAFGVFACAVAVGIGLGAENDALGYLAGRYFGLRCFGQIYGALLSAYLIGAALGAYFSARIHDATGSYDGALRVDVAAMVASCGLLLLLRRYDRGERVQ